MTQPAQEYVAQPSTETAGSTGSADRIDVLDQQGTRIGWMDPTTGERSLVDPSRGAEFNDTVDFWLAAAGLAAETGATPDSLVNPHQMHVREVRYPDPEVTRSLVIPLLRLA
jgi:hypothetical protein